MLCLHEAEHLVGTKDGIFCKKCNRLFVNFEEIEKDRDAQKTQNLGANSSFSDEVDKIVEKPKTKAVQAEVTDSKGAKAPRKKAVSKPKKQKT